MSMSRRISCRQCRNSDDHGYTLVELAVVLVIMPVIIGAIAFGLVSVFHLQTSVSQRLSGSVDLQKVNAQFIKDVQNSEQIDLGITPQKCGNTGVQLLGLTWNSGSTMVSYVSIPMTNNSTNYSLERLYCNLGNFSSPVNTTVLSSDFYVSNALLQQNPPSVCVNSLAIGDCQTTPPPSQCSVTPIPVDCQLVFNAHNVAGVTFSLFVPMSSVAYTMVAIPRGGSAPPSGNGHSSTSGITLLGSCSSGSVLSVGNGVLNINTLNTSTPGSGYLGLVGCPASAVSVANGGAVNAAGVLTTATGSTGIIGGNNSTYPTNVTYDPGLCNFLQNVPSGTGCPNTTYITVPPVTTNVTGTCQTISGANNQTTYNCSAGYYATTPTFANGSIINLLGTDPGTSTSDVTIFGSDFTVRNGSSLNFLQPNQAYVFAAPDGGAFSTKTSNQQNAGIAITGQNVLLYVPQGGMTFSNNTVVTLSGSTQWKGVDLWLDGVTNTPTNGDGILTLGNNSTSNLVNSYGGIYIPNGQVVDSNNGTIDVAFIVAGTASFANGLNVTITGY